MQRLDVTSWINKLERRLDKTARFCSSTTTAVGTSTGSGTGLGSLGMQQAKLGEAFQGLNINDINNICNGGQGTAAASERTGCSKTDTIPECMQPYQQLGFYSDIFQGMPTSQTTFT